MNLPTSASLAALLVAAAAAAMGCLLLLRKEANVLHRTLGRLLGATALTNLANGMGLLNEAHALLWRQIAMVGELAQPAALLYVGLAFLSPSERPGNSSMLWSARITTGAGCLLMIPMMTGHVFQLNELQDGQTAIGLAAWGRISYIFVVLGMASGLAQLELVLSASREPVRYQLKFILIGLGGLASYHIYQASQMLLFPQWQTKYVLVGALVTTMALALVSFGLAKTRLREVVVNAYISQQALLGSIAFIVTGLYLLAIGVAGEWLRRTGQPLLMDLGIVLAFGSLIALVILAFSKKVGSELRRLLARNFYRSKYDYRARWLEVTKTFQRATTKDAIIECLFDLLTKIFPTTTISIWSFREADRRFFKVRPIATEKWGSPPIESSHPIIMQMMGDIEPVLIQESLGVNQGRPNAPLDALTDSPTALCLPIRAQEKLTAFVAFSKQAHSEAYDTDDRDLLSGIAHYVGALLSHAALSEERQASAELEALHRFSLFCLHDLKNLASRLSLITQNVGSHGRDPAFQESAMRTVADTAKQITALVSKLSLKSFQPAIENLLELTDINALVEEVVALMRSAGVVPIHLHGGSVQPILGIREQIRQVLLNVVLNAKQAIDSNGSISMTVKELDGSVLVTVEDTGNGIPSDRLESLFRPSQSWRTGGLGIGLYQCKQIMEAHHGLIQVRSEEGKGTEVQLKFPLQSASERRSAKLMIHSTIP